MNGKEPTLEWDNDKATVLALREIAAGNITEEMLDEKPIISEEEGLFDQNEIDAEIGALLNTDSSEDVNNEELEAQAEDASDDAEILNQEESQPDAEETPVSDNDTL